MVNESVPMLSFAGALGLQNWKCVEGEECLHISQVLLIMLVIVFNTYRYLVPLHGSNIVGCFILL